VNRKLLGILIIIIVLIVFMGLFINYKDNIQKESAETISINSTPPSTPVRLIFIHHSVGENWLSDENGKLGLVLRDNNYFVSDTNYGWGPDAIGDKTDFGNWWQWFRGQNSSIYLNALYNESGQSSQYSRLDTNPWGENEIIMFKSCFPNSALQGSSQDPVPVIDSNPLKGQESGSEFHTINNAKSIYIDLLEYFKTRQDKLFIVVTAPPLSDPTYAQNSREFNNWLVYEWLKDYPYNNVAVFDLNGILTNGGNTLAYPSGWGDDHPNQQGNQKATQEFVNFINNAYWHWKNG
jgi:hypothetical protein